MLFIPLLLSCVLFMETLDTTIVNTAIPTIASEMLVSPISLKLVLTSYLLSLAVGIPMSGFVAERFGGKRVLLWSLLIFWLGSLICGMAPSRSVLVIGRLVQGCGGALMVPVARLLLLKSVPRAQLVRIMSAVTLPTLLGPAMGPVVGALICAHASWRFIFWVNLPMGMLAMGLAWWGIPAFNSPCVSTRRRFDLLGSILFGCGLAAGMFACASLGEDILSTRWLLGLLAVSVCGLLGFWVHLHFERYPLLRFRVFRVHSFGLSVYGNFLVRLSLGGMSFLLPLLLQLGMHYSPLQAAWRMLPLVVGMMLMKLFVPGLVGQWGFRTVLCAATLLLGMVLLMLAVAVSWNSDPGVLVLTFGYGLLSCLFFTSVNTLTYMEVPPKYLADATSIAAVVQHFSLSLGVSVCSLLLRFFQPVLSRLADGSTEGAYAEVFMSMGLLTCLASIIFLRLPGRLGRCSMVDKEQLKPLQDEASIF